MGLQSIWEKYKVLIVMGTSLGLIHWGWYNLKAYPLIQSPKDKSSPEPAVIGYVSPPTATKNK